MVTVACILNPDISIDVDLSDITVITTKDSGPGGQHRNKTESCVIIKDNKTGLQAKSAKKSQHQNRVLAKDTLVERIRALEYDKEKTRQDLLRKNQVGTGERSDKIRTYKESDNLVIQHSSNKRCRLTDIEKGSIQKLW
jgi:peptide chain release factor 1